MIKDTQVGLQNKGFNEARSFGVEIEFFGATYNRVIAELEHRGVSVAYEGYNHTTRNHWKLVTDVSVTGQGTGVGRGLELVSPVLKGKDGMAELKKVLDGLNAAGAKVDKTCGLHVHHDAHDFELQAFKNIFVMYYKFEHVIDAAIPKSRRGSANTYCKALDSAMIDRIVAANSLNEMSAAMHDNRYYKVNLQSYFRHKTIEFRHHSGTTEYEKITNWIMFTQAIVERACLKKVRLTHDRDGADMFLRERMMRRTLFGGIEKSYLGTDYGQAFLYIHNRRKHFEKLEASA